jgi:hypothetical protein
MKTLKFDQPQIDVKRDGDEYLTLYTSDELAERVIDRNKSLPGALGNAYERVKEILSGYTQIGGPAPRPNGQPKGNGKAPRGPQPAGGAAPNAPGNGTRRRRGRRTRTQRHPPAAS